MAEDVVDLEALLAPLEAGGGVGEDLRQDYSPTSPYQRLRDARATARAEERRRDGEGEAEAAPADGWRDVLRIGEEVLAGRAKDFEVAAWLTEAMVRFHGLDGVTAGAKLIAGLCEHFWDGAFPLPDEDLPEGERHEARESPISGLAGAGADGMIMQPLRRLALFRRPDGEPVALYQWDAAEEASTLPPERRAARLEAGVLDLSQLEGEARGDRARLTANARAARAALEAWRAMERVLDDRFGSASPSTRNVANLLERVIEVTRRLGVSEEEEPVAVEEAAPAAEAGGAAPPAGGVAPAARGPIQTREEALRELARLADFFRKTEPHSPLAYTLDDAVRRARMTLPELLAEILPDEDARTAMLTRLGIKPPE